MLCHKGQGFSQSSHNEYGNMLDSTFRLFLVGYLRRKESGGILGGSRRELTGGMNS